MECRVHVFGHRMNKGQSWNTWGLESRRCAVYDLWPVGYFCSVHGSEMGSGLIDGRRGR